MQNKLKFLSLCLVIGVLSFKFPSSEGDRYFHRLQKWYSYAQKGDWSSAVKLESQLDPADLVVYKKTHEPGELKKYINSLVLKNNKSTEDWLELARIQSILGKSTESVDSLTHARDMDPIRDDISKLYYQVTK